MIDFSGKRGLVLGVGNQRSIAWAIVEELHKLGAELGLTYLTEPKGRFEVNVRKLGDKVGASIIQECDVGNDESIKQLIETTEKEWGV
jgi:enoyl-[acyl-carrier protein] reductase I